MFIFFDLQQNSANGFRSSLKGTAYEGQDDQFVRTTPYFDSPYQPTYLNNNPATVSTYNSPQVKYYNDGRGNYGLPSLDNTPWRFFDPGMNNTPMYYPYRTAVFDNTQMSQNYGRTNLRMNDANFRLTGKEAMPKILILINFKPFLSSVNQKEEPRINEIK